MHLISYRFHFMYVLCPSLSGAYIYIYIFPFLDWRFFFYCIMIEDIPLVFNSRGVSPTRIIGHV